MSLETYWLMVAPGLLFGLSAVGWLALWVTRDRPQPTGTTYEATATFHGQGTATTEAEKRSASINRMIHQVAEVLRGFEKNEEPAADKKPDHHRE